LHDVRYSRFRLPILRYGLPAALAIMPSGSAIFNAASKPTEDDGSSIFVVWFYQVGECFLSIFGCAIVQKSLRMAESVRLPIGVAGTLCGAIRGAILRSAAQLCSSGLSHQEGGSPVVRHWEHE
jgi:hypothetical protein